ncbi:hypothetical protein WOLCODRAFT_139986 [Wolfiporia cocos MD-104 SS10]|uniref:Protein kinase domain-containing protein n=1 Tax=Wolfiporia cocos (strain MD-104) TaxID=742152 RepID=A0A2H3JD65_WOLCO|nr:hypothetical protein WOLCODRAFT_139986 [Wolfiporia cocos MD-104 SS10]
MLGSRVGEGQNQSQDTVAAPVELYCQAFAEFLTGLTDEPSPDIVTRTKEMMITVDKIATKEDTRSELTRTLSNIISYGIYQNVALYSQTSPPYETVALIIFEEKSEMGNGGCDPTAQASYSYERFWSSPGHQEVLNASCCPSFLVALAGPWLCVLGAVWTDHAVVQRLTDFLWLGTSPLIDDSRCLNIARVLSSLGKAVVTLRHFYASLDTSAPPPGTLPRCLSPCINSYYTGRSESDRDHPTLPAAGPVTLYPRRPAESDEEVEFDYIRPLGSYRACTTFLAVRKSDERRVVVKFVARYGTDAHRLLEKEGLAPELVYAGHILSRGTDGKLRKMYNNLFMVVMAYVEGITLADRFAFSALPKEIVEQVERAMTLLHGAGLVYGDLCRPNVMVTGEGKVQLVDFDWAGKEGVVRYPSFISNERRWASGVQSYAIIKAEHDQEMLSRF